MTSRSNCTRDRNIPIILCTLFARRSYTQLQIMPYISCIQVSLNTLGLQAPQQSQPNSDQWRNQYFFQGKGDSILVRTLRNVFHTIFGVVYPPIVGMARGGAWTRDNPHPLFAPLLWSTVLKQTVWQRCLLSSFVLLSPNHLLSPLHLTPILLKFLTITILDTY